MISSANSSRQMLREREQDEQVSVLTFCTFSLTAFKAGGSLARCHASYAPISAGCRVQRELTQRRKRDNQKVNPARQLRAETTMSLVCVAERLHMGNWSNVSNLLRKSKSAKSED